MKNIDKKRIIQETILSVFIMVFTFAICLTLVQFVDLVPIVPLIFNLAVFLISSYTTGYVYGVVAALFSVLAVNYAFTYPVFDFNFTIFENFLSAMIMLIIAVMTGAMTTKIKMQEKKRREMEIEKMRANLLRAISHDLRTPLTSIYGCSQTILECKDKISDKDHDELITGIRDDALWLTDMVENLLSVTRIEDGKLQLVMRDTSIMELFDEVVTKAKKIYPDVKIEANMRGSFISAPMDPILIGQVIFNLIENSILHGKETTKISLFAEEINQFIRISVKDDGCGVSKEGMKILFHNFANPDSYEKLPVDSKKRSFGIGLYVCGTIVHAHGGNISAENLEEGGFCVAFTIPATSTSVMEAI